MAATFYRWHQNEAPAFTADNAWSGLWGSTFSADGSQTQCRTCDGTGKYADMPCEECDGEGWEDCLPGYSCCHSAEDLLTYMRVHAGKPEGDEGRVIVFEGEQVDTGFDGEPTAVPNKILKEMTWSEFVRELA
jgi:hypothetical protein